MGLPVARPDQDGPVTVIEARHAWRLVDMRELVAYRDLFRFLTYRSIRTRYAQSALGIGWAIIQPVMTMVVFTFIFGRMVKVSSDGAPYAVFSFVALVPWTYFQEAFGEAANCLISEQNMIRKIYFPRLILPLSRVLARLLDFGISMIILVVLLVVYRQVPTWGVLLLPLFLLIMIFTAAGAGLFFGAMAVQYRDVAYGTGFLIRLLMYASPVIFPASLVPAHLRIWYGLNPMVGVIEGFRAALLGTVAMPWDLIVPGAVMSVAILLTGAFYFRSKERIFADVA